MSGAKTAIQNWLADSHSSYFNFRKDISRKNTAPPESVSKALSLPTTENSIAIVVIYNPTEEIFKNLSLLLAEFKRVLIVDNSPKSHSQVLLERFPNLPSSSIFLNGNRNGLAGALNMGIRAAKKQLSEGWIFFFDQDTTLKPNFLKNISEAVSTESGPELWNSLYCTEYDDRQTKAEIGGRNAGPVVITVPTVITSGSFLRAEAIDRIGIYIDEMFIDSLDHEFCLRAKRFGFKIKIIRLKLMYHSLGELHVNRFLWRKNVLTHNHAPFRWYFFTRNFIFSCAENYPLSWKWFIRYGKTIVKTYLKALLYEKHKFRKTLAAALGVVDGVLLVFGKNPQRDLSKF